MWFHTAIIGVSELKKRCCSYIVYIYIGVLGSFVEVVHSRALPKVSQFFLKGIYIYRLLKVLKDFQPFAFSFLFDPNISCFDVALHRQMRLRRGLHQLLGAFWMGFRSLSFGV